MMLSLKPDIGKAILVASIGALVGYIALTSTLPMVNVAGLLIGALAGSVLALLPSPYGQIGFAILAVTFGAALFLLFGVAV